MMTLRYSNEQLATIIGVPIVTILLIWTVVIFHKNRRQWKSYDIAVVAILVQSILRNIFILCYTTLVIANHGLPPGDYCKAVAWTFNSLHTFQASSLTTLAVVALFTVRMYKKQQNLQQYLTATHVIYHLFCLTTLCACVGVASILAQDDASKRNIDFSPYGDSNLCKFMPFELDIKFNIFIIVLHIFLGTVSLTAFVFMCFNHLSMRRQGFDYLKKSTSDLSELSLSLTEAVAKNYYDTYTIHRVPHLEQFENFEVPQQQPVWNSSDLSNFSMTVSSTNSKRPCLQKKPSSDDTSNGLHTMYPILTVCYLFNHLPLILLCIFPRLIAPWSVSGVALWTGQLQDVLIPIGLGLVDSKFGKWVSAVYKCKERRKDVDKIPPGVGLDGKFRHFGSQPQSLEVAQSRVYANEPKFPITNGSLYTSIDGRLPIIHNYRRNGCIKTIPTNLKRQDYVRSRLPVMLQETKCVQCDNTKRISRSQDCLNDLQVDLNKFKQNPSVSSDEDYSESVNVQEDYDAASQSSFSITTEANCDFEFYQSEHKKNFTAKCDVNQLRITRSNSKRSLENFQAYVNEENSCKIQRSNSFVTTNDSSVKYLENIYNQEYVKTKPTVYNTGSVPDFKRVFISEYI